MIFSKTASDTSEYKQYIPVHKNMAVSTLITYSNLEVSSLQTLGFTSDLWDSLVTYYEGATSDATLDEFLAKSQNALAWFTFKRAIPFNSIQIADAGNLLNTPGDVIVASDKSQKQLEYSALRTAYDLLEDLIFNFLLSNHGTFAEFDTSDVTEFFLHNPEQLLLHQDIHKEGKLETWLALRPYMRKVEKMVIKKILCKDLFDDLKSKLSTALLGGAALSSLDAELLQKVQAVTSEYTWSIAAPLLASKLTARGLKSSSQGDEQDGNANKHKDIEYFDIKNKKLQSFAVKDLLDFLEENKATYTDWAASSCYPNQTSEDDPCDACTDTDNTLPNCGTTVAI